MHAVGSPRRRVGGARCFPRESAEPPTDASGSRWSISGRPSRPRGSGLRQIRSDPIWRSSIHARASSCGRIAGDSSSHRWLGGRVPTTRTGSALQAPAWMLDRGWAVTAEVGGVTANDGLGRTPLRRLRGSAGEIKSSPWCSADATLERQPVMLSLTFNGSAIDSQPVAPGFFVRRLQLPSRRNPDRTQLPALRGGCAERVSRSGVSRTVRRAGSGRADVRLRRRVVRARIQLGDRSALALDERTFAAVGAANRS